MVGSLGHCLGLNLNSGWDIKARDRIQFRGFAPFISKRTRDYYFDSPSSPCPRSRSPPPTSSLRHLSTHSAIVSTYSSNDLSPT
jgi:hypothetical protein